MILRYALWFILMMSCSMVTAQSDSIQVEIDITSQSSAKCSGRFITHPLDYMTTTPNGDEVRQFEANGGGVAINDLDNDGDLDLVFANHGGMNTILWNEGSLRFRPKQLSHGDSRAVTIVDVDGDGWRDIFFTRTVGAPSYWRNRGYGRFELSFLPDIAEPLYSIAWADLDHDGDLDLVGATYDAGLLDAFGQDFLMNPRGGVYVYYNREGIFRPIRLATEAQGLALVLADINNDDRLDIVVGNDFAVPDYIWVQSDDGWDKAEPFQSYTYSTMSYDFADTNNDGQIELFASDMKPFETNPDILDAWEPVLQSLHNAERPASDRQVLENVFLMLTENNQFQNQSVDMGVDATGWSWSGKFGDLDQDGFLDLYVVNGFIEFTIFQQLPDHELVEPNQVFRNQYGERFEHQPDWRLSSDASGRGMSMADLDQDGDLDIVVNNLRHPAQVFENQLCLGQSLQVNLLWDGVENRHAIGSQLILETSNETYYRQVKSASGYLSGDTDRVHFGFPTDTSIKQLIVEWADGQITSVSIPMQASMVTIIRRIP